MRDFLHDKIIEVSGLLQPLQQKHEMSFQGHHEFKKESKSKVKLFKFITKRLGLETDFHENKQEGLLESVLFFLHLGYEPFLFSIVIFLS